MKNNLKKNIAYDTAVSILGVKQFVAYLGWKTEQYHYSDILSKILCGVFYSSNRIIAFEDIVMSFGSYIPRQVIGDALMEWEKYKVTTPHKDGEETYRIVSGFYASRKPYWEEVFWEFPLPLLSLMYGIGSNCKDINDVKTFIKKHNIKIEKVTE